jgi:hypothetical protein
MLIKKKMNLNQRNENPKIAAWREKRKERL